MSICMNISIKLLKSGFDANVKWGNVNGFGMLHHRRVENGVLL